MHDSELIGNIILLRDVGPGSGKKIIVFLLKIFGKK
jgi:hypothetical protein